MFSNLIVPSQTFSPPQRQMAATAVHAQAIHPNPIFEGMEKRLEIDFRMGPNSHAQGLRAIPRETLDELMTLAACCIVSNRSNAAIDAYVLSESSLFITESKWVLKTCGTTRLLNAIPRLLEVTQALGMAPRRCKYSRASFLFPQLQVSNVIVHVVRIQGFDCFASRSWRYLAQSSLKLAYKEV